jgi:hypothetical protein
VDAVGLCVGVVDAGARCRRTTRSRSAFGMATYAIRPPARMEPISFPVWITIID